MTRKVLHMNKIKEIIRLKGLGFSERRISKTVNCSRITVKKYLEKDSNPSEKSLTEDTPPHWVTQINWEEINQERMKGTPIKVLWEELSKNHQIFIDYPGFWKQVNKRMPCLKQSMHRVFRPGERTEIDYADGISILDPVTKTTLKTQFFLGVLCYSRFVFAEFTFSQKSEDFLSSHVRMFEAWGGTSQLLSPDNLKSAVTRAHPFDPVINPAYQKLASHYEIAVVPARVRTPKDKAIVERSIQIFQKWFYFLVRHRTFTSLMELNKCLKEHLAIFHQKKHRMLGKTRQEAFTEERAFLKSLPENSYEVQIYHRCLLSEDCHFVFEKNFYSSPFQYRGKLLDLWASPQVVEVYCEGSRIAVHNRCRSEYKWTTNATHYPISHQSYAEASPQSVILKAQQVGPATHQLIQSLLSVRYPLQNLRRAQGILALLKHESKERLESACLQANQYNQNTLHYLKRILKLKGACLSPEDSSVNIERGFNPFLRGSSGLFQ